MSPLSYFRYWLLLGWLAVFAVIYLSLVKEPPVELSFEYGDKQGHFVVYSMLMGWFVQLYQSRAMLIAYALFLVALGVVLEFLQGVTGRYFEYADMVANTLGVGVGLLLFFTPLRTLLQRLEASLPASH